MKLAHSIIFCLFICLLACKPKEKDNNGTSPLIVCTTGMIADMAKNIVGDKFQVKSLMGPGVDPHLYKATQGDLKSLQSADLIIYNGLHLEGKMTDILENLSQIKNVISVADQIVQDSILFDHNHAESPDPHIWFDVQLWASAIDGVAGRLSQLYPDNKSFFMDNADDYKLKLLELHESVKSRMRSIPEGQRILITAHDAFKYFGHAYDIEVRGLQGISTISEFGLKDRIELVEFIVENKIPSVFVESSVSEKNIQAIVEACRQKSHEVRIGASLYSDAMGQEGTEEGTYIGMVNHNVNSIVNGLIQYIQ